MSKPRKKFRIKIEWSPEDVQTLFDLTEDEAEDWLYRNEKHIQDRLTELGWDVIGDLGDYDGLPRKREDDDV